MKSIKLEGNPKETAATQLQSTFASIVCDLCSWFVIITQSWFILRHHWPITVQEMLSHLPILLVGILSHLPILLAVPLWPSRDFVWYTVYYIYIVYIRADYNDASSGFGLWAKTLRGQLVKIFGKVAVLFLYARQLKLLKMFVKKVQSWPVLFQFPVHNWNAKKKKSKKQVQQNLTTTRNSVNLLEHKRRKQFAPGCWKTSYGDDNSYQTRRHLLSFTLVF